jgi:hypothetical protein
VTSRSERVVFHRVRRFDTGGRERDFETLLLKPGE